MHRLELHHDLIQDLNHPRLGGSCRTKTLEVPLPVLHDLHGVPDATEPVVVLEHWENGPFDRLSRHL